MRTLLVCCLLVLAGCGSKPATPPTNQPGGPAAAKERISDFERPTLLKVIKTTEDPIRADLEAIVAKVLKHQDVTRREPDEVTFTDMFSYLGDANGLMDAARVDHRSADPFFYRELLTLIAEAKSKATIPSAIAEEYCLRRIGELDPKMAAAIAKGKEEEAAAKVKQDAEDAAKKKFSDENRRRIDEMIAREHGRR